MNEALIIEHLISSATFCNFFGGWCLEIYIRKNTKILVPVVRAIHALPNFVFKIQSKCR